MTDLRARREPSLGRGVPDLSELPGTDLPVAGPPAPVGARAARPWWLLLAAAVLALAVLLALSHWREPLGRLLVPDPPLTRQLAAAELALQRGQLSRPDGRGARELFQAVLAVDPDHPGARDGLNRVRDAALALADAALNVGDRVRARQALGLATALSAPAAELHPREARLRAAEATWQDVEQLLAQGQGWLREGRDGQALAAFEQVLQSQPGNALALEGRRLVLSEWLRQAEQRSSDGELAVAERLVGQVLAHDPSHLDLPGVQARLGERQAAQARRPAEAAAAVVAASATSAVPESLPMVDTGQRPIDHPRLTRLLAQADQAIVAGQLLEPPGDSAWDRLKAASAQAPDDAAVAQALVRFQQAARECFEREALANRLSAAEHCLAARSLRESPQVLADAHRRLALRWLALGSERIGQNEPELAQRALDSARRLDPRTPGLGELQRRLERVFGAAQR